jgi:hypothetical protein
MDAARPGDAAPGMEDDGVRRRFWAAAAGSELALLRRGTLPKRNKARSSGSV